MYIKVNALTDVTVGYMAAPWEGGRMTEHQQYCVVRNERGQKMLDLLQEKLQLGEAQPTEFLSDQKVGLIVVFL